MYKTEFAMRGTKCVMHGCEVLLDCKNIFRQKAHILYVETHIEILTSQKPQIERHILPLTTSLKPWDSIKSKVQS